MQHSSVDDILGAVIVIGVLLSIFSLIVSVLHGRSRQIAQLKATSDLRRLYERTYRKTPFKQRRFVSIARPGKIERRRTPPRNDSPPKA